MHGPANFEIPIDVITKTAFEVKEEKKIKQAAKKMVQGFTVIADYQKQISDWMMTSDVEFPKIQPPTATDTTVKKRKRGRPLNSCTYFFYAPKLTFFRHTSVWMGSLDANVGYC